MNIGRRGQTVPVPAPVFVRLSGRSQHPGHFCGHAAHAPVLDVGAVDDQVVPHDFEVGAVGLGAFELHDRMQDQCPVAMIEIVLAGDARHVLLIAPGSDRVLNDASGVSPGDDRAESGPALPTIVRAQNDRRNRKKGAARMGITDIVSQAARNAWSLFVADGIAPPHRTPSVVVGDGPHRTLRRFGPEGAGDPVLLVTPLAASPKCFDLMPDQSLVLYLLGLGRSVFVIEYGEMTSQDRDLGLEFWLDDVLPEAIERVSELCGNRDVDVVAWSVAGTLSLLSAAAHPELPLRSMALFGSPIDYSKIPVMAALRLAGLFLAEPVIGVATHLFGSIPAPIVQTAYRITALERELTRPWFIVRHLADSDKLARMELVDRFQDDIYGYAGRAFHQLAMRLTIANELPTGKLHLDERVVDLSRVAVPVLAFGGTDDVLAPIPAAEPITSVLTNAPRVRFVRVPGSHLGLLTGPTARTTSWVELAAFLADPMGTEPGAGEAEAEESEASVQSGTLSP